MENMSTRNSSSGPHGGGSDQHKRLSVLWKKVVTLCTSAVVSSVFVTVIIFLAKGYYSAASMLVLFLLLLILVTAACLCGKQMCMKYFRKDDHQQPGPTNMQCGLQPPENKRQVQNADTINDTPYDNSRPGQQANISYDIVNGYSAEQQSRTVQNGANHVTYDHDKCIVNISSLPEYTSPGQIETGIENESNTLNIMKYNESESDTRRPRTPPPSYSDVMDDTLYQT